MKNSLSILLVFCFSIGQSLAQLSKSNLPIFIIDTQNQNIIDAQKISASMKVIYKGEGKENNISDTSYNYNGKIGIELRGSSSQSFPKKPYSLELRTAAGADNPQELCGLPKEADWVLFASYSEKSFLHNVLTMSLGRKIGYYSSRTKFIELILNGNYQGLYILMERVKVDKNRVDIADLKPSDTSGDQLTGGYIVKIDKSTGSNIGSFKSNYFNKYGKASEYFYHAPKDINTAQKDYIRAYIRKFEDAIYNTNLQDTLKGYRAYADYKSFMQLFLLNEISKNVDGYRISSYFYKDKDSKGGKLVAGPPWDYDITYGNANYCQGNSSSGWAYKFNDVCSGDFWQVPGFWDKLMSDNFFIKQLRSYYFTERKSGGLFDLNRLKAEIDGYTSQIQDAQSRNFLRWPILGQYVWPNPTPVPSTYAGEVTELKTWLERRLLWLDQNMPEELIITSTEPSTEATNIRILPNPFIEKFQIQIFNDKSEKAEIQILNTLGQTLAKQKVSLAEGLNELELPFKDSEQKMLIVKLTKSSGQTVFEKAIKVGN
jgi:hypothetical protein